MSAMDLVPIRRALISVSDKSGLIERASKLRDAGVELLSTGGTLRALTEAGLEARDVAEVTEVAGDEAFGDALDVDLDEA